MNKRLLHVFYNQHGSVINVALLILILIFLIGIGLSKMSTTDIRIANNIKQEMTTFYEADASLESAAELIEQNLACITGFRDKDGDGEVTIGGTFVVTNIDFAHNSRDLAFIPSVDASDADFYFPPGDYSAATGEPTSPHSNIAMGGASRFSKGSAIQMAAGYEGLGKGAAAGGGSIIYDVYALRIGLNNTSSTHFMQWVHLIKPAGGCSF
jgi:hypothetical protein